MNPIPAPSQRLAYLDHAAATPMLPQARSAMVEVLAATGNAASLHGSGRAARRRVEEAREAVAAHLGARPSEVVFTSGGTESDNLAVKGLYWSRRAADPARRRVVASPVEHHAVLDAVQWLVDHDDAEVTWLPVAADGSVDPADLRSVLRRHADDTALVTVMWANNEVGTVMPVAALADVAAEFGVPLHTDAVQAVGKLPVDFGSVAVSALSLAAHKFGGPHGVGALLLRRDVAVTPLQHGGGHERDVRSGTPDVPGVVGMAAALRVACASLPTVGARVADLRDRLAAGVAGIEPDAVRNGASGPGALPGIAHFSFPGCEGDSLLMLLDARGVECSTGSACTVGVARASHVLLAMGVDPVTARGSLRFSLGHTSVDEDVDQLLAALPQVLERARLAGMAAARGRGR